MPLQDYDSAVAYAFSAEVDGIQIKNITEVTGLKIESDVVELKMNTEDGKYVVRKMMGRDKPGEVTMTRYLTDNGSFSDWMEKVGLGQLSNVRKNGFVNVLDTEGTPIRRFQFLSGFVKSLELSQLQAGSNNAITEKVTIAHEGMKIVPG